MIRKRHVFLVLACGLLLVCAQTISGDSVEWMPGPAAQATKEFRVSQVSVRNELVHKAPSTFAPGLPQKETVWPYPGQIFVVIEFSLLVDEATASLVLVDSAGARHLPIGISPFSAPEFQFFVPMGRVTRVPASIQSEQSPGGKLEVSKDDASGLLTIKVARVGTKFSAAWRVPQAAALRRSEFKLHIGDAPPLALDTLASARKISLHDATWSDNRELVEWLLAQGADVNAKNEHGVTPLHLAIMRPNKEIAELLLVKGADVNAKAGDTGATPLHLAVRSARKDLVQLLLAKGADVNAKDNDGKTPPDLARADDIKALLRQYGAQ